MTALVQHLMIVDDAEDDVFFTKRALAKAGYAGAITWLSSGQDAIDYFAAIGATTTRPDIVLLDIKMPVISGFDVLEWLQNHPVLPLTILVVMLSSSGDVKDRAKAAQLGAHDYAVKPADQVLFDRLAVAYGLIWR